MTKDDSFSVEINDKKYNVIIPNYYGFIHDKVAKIMEGEFEYLGTINVRGGLWACYRNYKPNAEKKHKDVMMLNTKYVSGIDMDEFKEYNDQLGKACYSCGEIIYSAYRHDYRKCSCGKVMVDGGGDYFKASANGLTVKIDFLNKSAYLTE